MKGKILLVSVALLLTVGLLLGACAAPAPQTPAAPSSGQPAASAPGEVIKWKGQHYFPTTVAPYGPFGPGQTGAASIAQEWEKWIEEASNGRLQIELAEPGAIFPTAEALDAVKAGTVDLAFCYPGLLGGKLPEAYVEEGLPFAWQSIEEEEAGLFRYGVHEMIKEAYAEQGVYWIPYHTQAIVGVGTIFPAPNPESMKGKKIRAVGLWGDYIAMLGGSPVPAAWGDMYMGLKLGTFDGWVAGSASLEELKLKEVTKGFVRNPMISRAQNNLLINMKSYEALPDDLKVLFDRDSRYVFYRASENWERQCAWVLANASKEYGLQIYDWSPEDQSKVIKQAVETIWPKVADKSPRLAKMVDAIKKEMQDYGKLD